MPWSAAGRRSPRRAVDIEDVFIEQNRKIRIRDYDQIEAGNDFLRLSKAPKGPISLRPEQLGQADIHRGIETRNLGEDLHVRNREDVLDLQRYRRTGRDRCGREHHRRGRSPRWRIQIPRGQAARLQRDYTGALRDRDRDQSGLYHTRRRGGIEEYLRRRRRKEELLAVVL